MKKRIFASGERQRVLEENGIKFKVDQELEFVFDSEETEKKAIKLMKKALVL